MLEILNRSLGCTVDTEATADRARQRIAQAQTRLTELRARMALLTAGKAHRAKLDEQVGRARRLAADSCRHAHEAMERALRTHLAAVQMHNSVALLHDG